jgi:hypothetical protein
VNKLHVAAGAELLIDERPWRIVSFDGRTASLRALDDDDAIVTLTLAELLASTGLRGLAEGPHTGPSRPALVEGLSAEQLQQAIWRREHVMEVLHGHPAGEWADPSDEPREGYDVQRTTKTQRIALKAEELKRAHVPNASERTVRRWVADYRLYGLLGLVNRRHSQLHSHEFKGSPEVLEVLDELVVERSHLSTKRLTTLHADLRSELRERFPDHRLVGLRQRADGKVLRLPRKTAFYELVEARYRGSHLTGESTARRSKSEMPPVAFNPFRATRSGEIVQIDSTRLDLLALNRATGSVVRAELTLAVDAFDHSIRAVRVAAEGTRGVDVALMVFDMLCPTPWRPEWGPECAWNYHGVPEQVIIDLAGERLAGSRPARAPFGQPQTVVCDRGKIYLSKTFFGACEQFGISVQPAPPKTPNYKGVVEQAFDTLKEHVIERLPGHVGRGAHHRGLVDGGPMLFIDQLEDLVTDWAVTVYHRRRHDGCRLPDAPQVAVTPNHMFEYSIARSGFITVPASPERLVECLPSKTVVLQDYGVNLNGLRYYDPVLENWRVRRSPWHPESGKPNHPVHFDPRDLSKIWFYEPDSGQWVALHRRNAMHPDVPFNDSALAWVKKVMAEDGYQTPDPDLLDEYMDAFLERQLGGQTLPQERRLVARMLHDARAASTVGEAVPPLRLIDEPDGEPEEVQPKNPDRRKPSGPLPPPTGPPEEDDGPPLVDDDDIEPLPLVDDDTFAEAF